MADDEAAPDRSLSRQQQPAADLEFIGRGVDDVMDAPVRMARPAFAKSRLRIHAERADIARAPKVIEVRRRLRRPYRTKLVNPKAVGGVEIKGVVCRDAHGMLVSVNKATPRNNRINRRRHGWARPGDPRGLTQETEKICHPLPQYSLKDWFAEHS